MSAAVTELSRIPVSQFSIKGDTPTIVVTLFKKYGSKPEFNERFRGTAHTMGKRFPEKQDFWRQHEN